MKKLKKLVNILDVIQRYMAAFCILLLSVLICIDIFGRELFSQGVPWAQKCSVYLMIWAGFLGASITNIKGAHLRPEVADKLWPEKMKPLFHRLRHLVTSIFCFFGVWFSSEYVQESVELGDTSPILNDFPLWIVQFIIPATFFLMGIVSLIYSINSEIAPNKKREIH